MSADVDFEATAVKVEFGESRNPCEVRVPERAAESELTSEAKRAYNRPSRRIQSFDAPSPGWLSYFYWDNISQGDCHMTGAMVYIYPDGQIYFTASTSTSSSGDVWIINWIQFTDSNGNDVGRPVGKHDSQTMAWENSSYPFVFWDAIPGALPEAVQRIAGATMNNHC